jgi:glucose-1-phosphate adenylyltransferase
LKTGADITVCVKPVGQSEAPEFGILKMEGSGRITRFSEKPKAPELVESLKVDLDTWREAGVTAQRSLMASMGVYLFSTQALIETLKDDLKVDFGRDVIPSALSDFDVRGYIFADYWADIGTIRAFYDANLDLTLPEPQFSFYDSKAPIYSHPRFLPASRIRRCRLNQSILSEGCEIEGSEISQSVIGIRSILREGTVVTRVLMLGADFYEPDVPDKTGLGVGEKTVIQDAIIDKNARIGSAVRILNEQGLQDYDGPDYFIRDKLVIIPKNAVIESGTVI